MITYAILQNPGHNRVYFKTARALAQAELQLAGQKMSTVPINSREETLGGIPYLLFDTKTTLTEMDIKLISRLSFVYGIFEWINGTLIPLEKNPDYYFDNDDITTILKYNGKTNELFTRMLLNTAMFNSKFNPMDKLTILDPLCGKGTTLFEGLLCGHNIYGVDIDDKMIHEAYIFLKKYLETVKYKHSTHQERQGMKAYTALHYQMKLSRSKADKDPLLAEFVAGDTRHMDQFYRKSTFHVIVGDLPYGVQHGSKVGKNAVAFPKKESRNALPMLSEALSGWHKVLKTGGTLALAWNLFLIDRQEMESALENNGFALTAPKGDESFVHRVDQAINRDAIVGIKR